MRTIVLTYKIQEQFLLNNSWSKNNKERLVSNFQVLAVKKIDSSLFKGGRPEEFSEIVANISKLHHQNIAELVGYCSEQGHNMLIHEYFRNGSLHNFLHMSDEYSRPLTWNTRVRIALGTARAIEYVMQILCYHKFWFSTRNLGNKRSCASV